MTTRKYIVLGISLIVLAGGGMAIGAMLWETQALPPQPIAFNHRLHMERAQGIGCEDCHLFAPSQTYAGLPSKLLCFGCHDPHPDETDTEADARKPEFADLMAFVDADGDIPWHRVTAIRQDVFFSHRMHVTVAGLDCRACHAQIADSTRPPSRGPSHIPMATCIDCHEENGATADCVRCHR